MEITTGVTKLFSSFLPRLYKNRAKIAPLQLSGRLEDYLVHEFIAHIFLASHGQRFGVTNFGNRGEQRFDIAVLARIPSGDLCTLALIEAKYLRNRQKLGQGNAMDETKVTLRDLRRQLVRVEKNSQGGIKVRLTGRRREVYGLVFGSYVCESPESDDKKDSYTDKKRFYDDCLKKAEECRLRYHDLPYLRLPSVFEDEPVIVLGTRYLVSLRAGLWRPAEPLDAPAEDQSLIPSSEARMQ